MGQRCVHYTERDNGTRVLYAPNECTYVISPIVTKVSVLSNLRISGCELRDNYYVSFTKLFKKKKYRYIGISVILSPIAGFLSLVRVTQFYQFEKGMFCP